MSFLAKILLFSLGIANSAYAGYRVHELKLSYFGPNGKLEKTDTILSTLDHRQYEHYHGGYRNLRAELVDTWYCPGDTHRKDYCERPKEAPTRGPASTNEKRLPLNRQLVIPQ